MGRKQLNEAILAAGGGVQLVFLGMCPVPTAVAFLLPLATFAVFLTYPIADTPGSGRAAPVLLAAASYLSTFAYCLFEAMRGVGPEGGLVFAGAMVPGAVLCVSVLRRIAVHLSSRERIDRQDYTQL
jgi:hypothetical protein